MNHKYLIIWDWDGTIINNHASALKALQDMADTYGLPAITEDDLQSVMGAYRGAFWTFHFQDKADEPYRFFIKRFEQYNLSKTPVMFDGVSAALNYIKGIGMPQVVLSNMPQEMLDEESKRAGLTNYFHRLRGLGDKPKERKPYIEQVQKATQGISYNTLIMIGDGESDLMTAKNVGARMIYIAKKDRSDFKYDFLAKSHTEILNCLKYLIEGD